MKKTIKIGDKEVKLESNARTFRTYKRMTGRDPLIEFFALAEGSAESPGESINQEFVYDMMYCLAKKGDPNIPDDIDDWLDEFDEFPLADLLFDVVVPMIEKNVSSSQESKKKPGRPKKQ